MEHYDLIIIGTGAGGGTLLYRLKDCGKKILVLERGDFLPREKANWDTIDVFQKGRYHTTEVWKANNGSTLHPGVGYWVGGNTKVYGAALFRLRERDFERVEHAGGISPQWPLKYADFEPYYTQAEALYCVHGKMGDDSTEPTRSGEFPYPPILHEPRIQEVHDELVKGGYHPFYMPMGIKMDQADMLDSPCIRCNTCDGFPCLIHAKSDSDINCVRPSLNGTNITLLTRAKVTRLATDASGGAITSVEVSLEKGNASFSADLFVLAAGAINSAALLLASASDQFPQGLANRSGMVGRHLMKHQNSAMLGISNKLNPTIFQKTMALNDFYWGEKDYRFPMGHVQLLGKSNRDMIALDAPGITPGAVLEDMATHSVDWWMSSEDLPDPENRVTLDNGQIHLYYRENNKQGFERLISRWSDVLKSIDVGHYFLPHHLYLNQLIPLSGLAHQNGTLRFGTDPDASVLNLNCRTHDLDNLYVVDGSFFPSCGAVNPSLTIMANALRVGDHLLECLK